MSLGNREDSGPLRSLSQKTCLLFIIQYHVDLGFVWQGPSALFCRKGPFLSEESGEKKTAHGQERGRKMEQKNKRNLIAVLALVAVLALAGAVYLFTRPSTAAGEKHIVVEVVDESGSSREFTYDTDEEYLRGVLEGAGLIAGDESDYGLFVKTVDGYTANDANQEWWCFTKGGEQVNTGVDTTPIADGDHFEITLTKGY